MKGTMMLLPLGVLGLCSSVLGHLTEKFDERLHIRSLADGRVQSNFAFTTLLQDATPRDPRALDGEDESQHYTLFPLALGQILREWGVTELHLSLNAGKWDYDRWGYPEEANVGTGAELWAWMGEGGPSSIDRRWLGLRNSLAGLFCASLGSMSDLRTSSPPLSYAPDGDLPEWSDGFTSIPHRIRHASLPSENVCTENLTPFLKLLPCKSLAGIAALLNPHKLFDADWHGMGLHVLWHKNSGVQVRLTFQSVSDPLRTGRAGKQDWSFRSLFDRTVDRACPAAHTSEIIVDLPKGRTYALKPEPTVQDGEVARYDVSSHELPINVNLIWAEPVDHRSYVADGVPFTVQRTLMGSTQEHGHISLVLENHMNTTTHALWLETMPWLVQFYLHTLEARVRGKIQEGLVSNISYTLPIPHGNPTIFQALVTLPPKETVHLTMEISKAFLRYTEHPPDAQRGWDLPPAVLTPVVVINDRLKSIGERIYTPVVLVDLATPDFSMPYNVIIFSCSLIAFLFGSVFNLLTRKFVVVGVNAVATEKKEKEGKDGE